MELLEADGVHEEPWGNNGTKYFNHPTARFEDVLRQNGCHIEQNAH
jgi:hypothetical protein